MAAAALVAAAAAAIEVPHLLGRERLDRPPFAHGGVGGAWQYTSQPTRRARRREWGFSRSSSRGSSAAPHRALA